MFHTTVQGIRQTALGFALGGLVFSLALGPDSGAVQAGEPFVIRDGGRTRTFDLATDELQPRAPSARSLHFAAFRSPAALRQFAVTLRAQTGAEFNLVLYERGLAHGPFTRRILTRQIAARLADDAVPDQIARALNTTPPRAVPGLRGWFLFEAPAMDGAPDLAARLRALPGVRFAEALLARQHQAKFVPNDTFLPLQWHLLNTGQNGGTPGVDIGITNVWDTWRGAGMTIGIVDDGLQFTHPDLAPNVNTNLGWNFNDDNSDPSPTALNPHGTSVAGIAAARANNGTGVAGVAFESTLVGLRLLGAPDTDAQDAAAMLLNNNAIQIKNNSWGAADGFGDLDGPGPLMISAIEQGVQTGRDGLGTVYLFAGGNGRTFGENVNYDGFANSRNVIAVCALSDHSEQATYSEPGACLVVTAPSSSGPDICSFGGRQGITTTDLLGDEGYNFGGAICEVTNTDYTQAFGGTSAATPMVSGVVALMLQANPTLGWRDVTEILLRSARRINPTDPDWSTNSSGVAHNHKFGAGLLNARRAVDLAMPWRNLGAAAHLSVLLTNLAMPVPDNNPTGVTLTFPFTNAGFRVEHAVLTLTLPHENFGDLAITLVSPGGTASRLAEVHSSTGNSYDAWPLNSIRDWGEMAAGTWTLNIADLVATNTGTLEAAELSLYGSVPIATLGAAWTNAMTQLRLAAPAVGWRYSLDTSTNLVTWMALGTVTIGTSGEATLAETNAANPRRFYRARLMP